MSMTRDINEYARKFKAFSCICRISLVSSTALDTSEAMGRQTNFRLLYLRIRRIKSPFVGAGHLRGAVIQYRGRLHCRPACASNGLKSFGTNRKSTNILQINNRSHRYSTIFHTEREFKRWEAFDSWTGYRILRVTKFILRKLVRT